MKDKSDPIASAVLTILKSLGEDPRREGLEKTPQRVANSLRELTSGYKENIDTVFLGQMEEDAYCLGYWYNTCQDMFDYYNYLDSYYGQPDPLI